MSERASELGREGTALAAKVDSMITGLEKHRRKGRGYGITFQRTHMGWQMVFTGLEKYRREGRGYGITFY